MSFLESERAEGGEGVNGSFKAASSPGRSYNLADVDASCGLLGSVQLVIFFALVVN